MLMKTKYVRMSVLVGSALMSAALFGALPATTPCCPDEVGCRCWWFEHFDGLKQKAKAGVKDVKVVFLGDSITHLYAKEVWNENYTNDAYRAINFGICGDRTEHVLWRLQHGQMDNLDPKAIVLLIGTNNTWHRKIEQEVPGDTIYGIRMVVRTLLARCPNAKVILHPIFPIGADDKDERRIRNAVVNRELPRICDGRRVFWCDFNSKLLESDGVTLSKETAPDLVHPGPKGYRIWAENLKPTLDYVLGYSKERPANSEYVANDPCKPSEPYFSAWIDYRTGYKREEIAANASKRFDLVLMGDSITHNWEERGTVARREILGDYSVLNLGFAGDKVENLLWGVRHGGYCDGYSARVICIMIGTNNRWCKRSTPAEIAAGIALLTKEVAARQPEAKILLSPVFPLGAKPDDPKRIETNQINDALKALKVTNGRNIVWFDFTDKLVEPDGTLSPKLFPDACHPSDDGYNIWAWELKPYLQNQN